MCVLVLACLHKTTILWKTNEQSLKYIAFEDFLFLNSGEATGIWR